MELRPPFRPAQPEPVHPGHHGADAAAFVTQLPLHHLDGSIHDGSIHDGSDATKATVSVSSKQVIVDGGFVDQHFRRHSGVLEDLRRALGNGRRAGVRGVADRHDPRTAPGRWDLGARCNACVQLTGVRYGSAADIVPGAVVAGGEAAHDVQLRATPAAPRQLGQ